MARDGQFCVAGRSRPADGPVPLEPGGSAFQRMVWDELRTIHRVIGSGGNLTGYGGGLWRKRRLLDLEQSVLSMP